MDSEPRYSNDSSPSPLRYESSGPLALIVIPSLLALCTVSVVSLIFCSLYRHKQRAKRNMDPLASGPPIASASTPKAKAILSPWELPEESALGELQFWRTGRYGPICRGVLTARGGASSAVVVKSLREGTDPAEAKEFVEWVQFHAKVCKHKNVVRLLHCQTRQLPLFMVLGACSPGNLLDFLWSLRNSASHPEQVFSEASVFLVAKQVAAGLDFLMSEHRLVHGHVAARSVLLGEGLTARLSGLGVAFSGRCSVASARNRVPETPLKWQAPERIIMQLSIDRSDVWSFGIFLYELVTLGDPPYPELEPLDVLPKLQGSYRMKRPKNCGGPLYDLMKYCWMWSFKDRPAFSAIIKLLDSSLPFARTDPIRVDHPIDVSHYERAAGLLA